MEVDGNRVLVKIHNNTYFVLYLLISHTNPLFLLGKNFGDTRHLCQKNEPTLDRFGVGVHGMVSWLIVY